MHKSKGSSRPSGSKEKGGKAAYSHSSSISSKSLAKERSLTALDYRFLAGLTLFASVIRFYKLNQPSSVVFDEVHFGGFARKYILGQFFMDVHPPLAKMMFAVVGYLAGYDGTFDFKTIGLDYLSNNVPYVAMRMLPAALGVLSVLLSYATLRASGCRSVTALFGAGLLTIDNALTTQSRYILLDSPVVFFISLTTYGFVRFMNEAPLQRNWFRYLFLTGLGLGATMSSKWVGLFTVGWVGVLTVWQLWWILADLSVSPTAYCKQFASRAMLLIGVPLAFYLFMFYIHFLSVANNGDGASFFSPEFQSTLKDSPLVGKFPADVALGSTITLRHVNTQGGYLHSHPHLYETGSKQQQITLYPHKDVNNDWLVENITRPEDGIRYQDREDPVLIEDGAIIRLKHVATHHRLHSHDVRPPVTEQDYQNEVSAYGYEGFDGDANDNFRVEIIKDQSRKGPARERLRAMETKFRLVHTMTGCILFSHSVKLPKWGFEQQEVTCVRGPSFANSIWQIEQNSHPHLDATNTELVSYHKPSFFEKFIELNKVMWKINADLTATHPFQSRPESWIIMKRGINFWVKDHRQVYLIGNGIIWWSIPGLVLIFSGLKIFELLRWQRGYPGFNADSEYKKFDIGVAVFLLGWAFHYFPSFFMERQLFLHHYLASVYFGVLAIAQTWEYIAFKVIKVKFLSYALLVTYFTAAGAWFVWYSPLIYGNPWTKSLCEKSKFLDMDFDCNVFFDTYAQYDDFVIPTTPVNADVVVTVTETDIKTTVETTIETASGVVEGDVVYEDVLVEDTPVVEYLERPAIVKGEEGYKQEDSTGVTGISAQPIPGVSSLKPGEKIVYQDENGNPLNEEQVQNLIANGQAQIQKRFQVDGKFYNEAGEEIPDQFA